MTTVEKRRSGRKSGGHRKHSDGGYSDTSSAGSFPDENDREVSSLTDRAFRSLCIGDEAVYNDSDLSLSSPCTQRDKQLAFSQHGQDREREELKRAAHENFSLRVQQYEEDWIRGGVYGSEIHRDPQWEVYGQRTHGGVSATFQHSFVETSQPERSMREEQLSTLSNGGTELNSQQLRSRSRVSSLIRAFNSEGQRDVMGMDDRFREWSDETSWDKSALMSIQRELSEFSASYQQNFNSGHFPSVGPFSPQDNNFYSPDAAAVAHMSHHSAASFMRSSHSKHGMSAQVNCNSNFFIHSEFSPFKVWRDHNRFPFQHGQVSGFMHCSQFPQWYETPMYKELSLQDRAPAPCRGARQSHLAPVVPPTPPRSTSTSMVIQKASAMEKRCESELAGHYPHRKRTQSLGPNRLPSQRPSTASPTTEMSRRVRDTISSVKALQQKVKRMAEQNSSATGVINDRGDYYCNNNVYPFENNAVTVASGVVRGNTSTTPFKIGQLPSANSHPEAETSELQHYDLSAPPVEHPPVRAESRGATPDVRMSSYKSRATSLLFNLKDNRKRVKSTYSPTKFKGLETQEKNKQPSTLEPKETVIDIPESNKEELFKRNCKEELCKRNSKEELHKKSSKEELHKKSSKEELHKRSSKEELHKKSSKEELHKKSSKEELHKKSSKEELHKRSSKEELHKKSSKEELHKRSSKEELHKKSSKEKLHKRSSKEELHKKSKKEQQRRAAQEEQQRRAAQEEQQRKAAQEKEQQRRAVQEEQQRRAAQEEQQRRAAQEEQQRRAAQEEQQRRAAQEEQQRRAAQEEQQRAAQKEQQRKAAQEEKQRRAAIEEQERRAAQEVQQRRTAQEEQQKIYAEELQRRDTQGKPQGGGEHQKRAPQEKERRATLEELQRRVANEEQRGQATQEEQQRRPKQIITDNEEEKRKRQREENNAAYISKEKVMKQILENQAEQQIEEKMQETHQKELLTRIQKHGEEKKNILKQGETSQTKGQRSLRLEDSQAEVSQDIIQEQDDEFQTKSKEEKELATHKEKMKAAEIEKQRQVAQTDALQYYAITSAEPDKKHKERQLFSPLSSQQRNTPGLESADWPYRPHAPVSPAPSLPRSTTSSPALGGKPLMFRVKDNTMRGSSFTKSVKPRFHKNFGEDSWGGLERGEDQEIMRRRTGTPVHVDSLSNRLLAPNESSISRSVSSLDGYSAPLSYHRPYSRRSIVIDDDDSRSVFSATSDGVESFATSATDLADIRGLYDYDRPESACSFSSDVSRSMGKPPTVPPKSEKALRRAQRLTTRRMKKELSKVAETDTVGLPKEGPIICSSSSTEVRSSNCHAVASPHFTPPVSLAHARTVGSSLPPSHAEQQAPHRSFHAFPHATGPISLPNSSAHANPAVTLPAAPKTVTHVPSSPTLHHVNHPAPVTQYQVESSYPQSFPLTQRKVLQDLGSGQYFLVDVPVEVKTKTFIDPETGKYVQLNVRESGQGIARHQPNQTRPQAQLQPQRQIKQQQPPLSQVSPAGKPAVLYQGYHGYPNYQPAAIKSLHSDGSSAPAGGQPGQQPVGETQNGGYPAPETGQNTEEHRYSPEKTPYMDTVNDTDKRHSRVYGTHGSNESFPECDTNSQLAGRSVCENDNSAPSQYQPREIITMSELEDFMEISDW
ncbi:cardiac-enriched FHL2-interacting protein [Salarias fasciatus]|uniref:cardiac-enriched FHL2-interacting protein n=1 Tax=Salarias fasciatus TaxID=181472 RepID=UPI0011768B5F|nr:cardiac-enriched FHL2-interacting protein-like [Salarias fasciatus]